MTYEEKGAWVYLAVVVATSGAYSAIILRRLAEAPASEVRYVPTLLWTLVISVGLAIIVRIALEIASPSESYAADVRDTEIGRFGG